MDTNESLDHFFLNLNRTKNILTRYPDFSWKVPEISIDFIIFPFQLFDDEFSQFYLVIAMVSVSCFISNAKRSIDIQVKREFISK